LPFNSALCGLFLFDLPVGQIVYSKTTIATLMYSHLGLPVIWR